MWDRRSWRLLTAGAIVVAAVVGRSAPTTGLTVEGSEAPVVTHLPTTGVTVERFAISPDGRSIVAGSAQLGFVLFDSTGAGPARRLTFASTATQVAPSAPVFSADGRWVIVPRAESTSSPRLYVAAIDGSGPAESLLPLSVAVSPCQTIVSPSATIVAHATSCGADGDPQPMWVEPVDPLVPGWWIDPPPALRWARLEVVTDDGAALFIGGSTFTSAQVFIDPGPVTSSAPLAAPHDLRAPDLRLTADQRSVLMVDSARWSEGDPVGVLWSIPLDGSTAWRVSGADEPEWVHWYGTTSAGTIVWLSSDNPFTHPRNQIATRMHARAANGSTPEVTLIDHWRTSEMLHPEHNAPTGAVILDRPSGEVIRWFDGAAIVDRPLDGEGISAVAELPGVHSAYLSADGRVAILLRQIGTEPCIDPTRFPCSFRPILQQSAVTLTSPAVERITGPPPTHLGPTLGQLSPDSRRRAWNEADRLMAAPSDGSSPPVDLLGPAPDLRAWQWGPDSRFIIAAGGPTGLQRIDLTGPPTAAPPSAVAPGATRFVPLLPARVFDTRDSGAPIPADGTLDVEVLGQAGIPMSGVRAVALNVTATESTGDGFLTVWATGQPRPLASTHNLGPGSTAANQVIVPVGDGGRVSFYSQAGTHLLADVAGYFVASGASSGGRIVPLAPQRLLDTRDGGAAVPGPGAVLNVAVAGRGGVPSTGAAAVIVNLTATEAAAPGYVTAFPSGQALPRASTLNLERAGHTVANLAIVPLGADGAISLATQASAHLVVDVAGYMTGFDAAVSAAGLFVPVTPARLFDTREPPSPGPVAAGGVLTVPVSGIAGVDASAGAVVMNLTATQAAAPGYVTAWPFGPMPLASHLNLTAVGETRPNAVLVPLSPGGSLNLTTQSGAHLLADAAGWITG